MQKSDNDLNFELETKYKNILKGQFWEYEYKRRNIAKNKTIIKKVIDATKNIANIYCMQSFDTQTSITNIAEILELYMLISLEIDDLSKYDVKVIFDKNVIFDINAIPFLDILKKISFEYEIIAPYLLFFDSYYILQKIYSGYGADYFPVKTIKVKRCDDKIENLLSMIDTKIIDRKLCDNLGISFSVDIESKNFDFNCIINEIKKIIAYSRQELLHRKKINKLSSDEIIVLSQDWFSIYGSRYNSNSDKARAIGLFLYDKCCGDIRKFSESELLAEIKSLNIITDLNGTALAKYNKISPSAKTCIEINCVACAGQDSCQKYCKRYLKNAIECVEKGLLVLIK